MSAESKKDAKDQPKKEKEEVAKPPVNEAPEIKHWSSEDLTTEIVELFKDIEEALPEEDQDAVYSFIARLLSKQGYACIKVEDLDDNREKLFNKMQLFNSVGSSKTPRLDTIKRIQEAHHYSRRPEIGDSTAKELVTEILSRAGIPDSRQKQDLIIYFSRALLLNISDPAKWQNPLWDFDPIAKSTDE